METYPITNLTDALEEVRKAHRLIHSFQERMLSLMRYIQTKLDFPNYLGVKHFSNPIGVYSRGNYQDYLKVYSDMWAWDFLYSYVFEYYLGEGSFENDDLFSLSIIQYADTGYFENENEDKNMPSLFAPTKESTSKLLFILEVKPKKTKEWIWNIGELAMTKEYASKNHTQDVITYPKGNKQLLYSIPLDQFANEETALKALRQYAEFCCQEAGFEMDDFKLD